MPRFIRRLQMARPMPRIPPVTSATWPFMSAMTSPEYVLSRRVGDGLVLAAAHAGRLDELARPLIRPGGPVFPPGALLLGGMCAPGLWPGRVPVAGLVPRLGSRRVDDPGDVATAGQHVPDLATHQLAGLVRAVPGHDVVVDRADYVGVVLHVGQRQDLPAELELALGQLVPHVQA